MREIKFRAWVRYGKDNYQMITYNKIDIETHYDFFSVLLGSDETIEIMQFTGLKDKNGKEIYEGDIVKSQKFKTKPHSKAAKCKRFVGFVEFSIGKGVFGDKKLKYYSAEWRVAYPNKESYRYGEWGDFLDCEVIGNIYENKELLKNADKSSNGK